MTENKRFKFDSEVGVIDTQKCGGDTMTLFEVVVELNKLNEKNNQSKQLLREVEHELTSLTGLSCFDKCASQLGYVEVFDKDMWELDYTKLLAKIEKELQE